MKFNYKLRRLCGAYYGHPLSTSVNGSATASSTQWSGSNVVYDSTGNLLLTAVSNRIQVLDLKLQTVRTLPVEARSNIRCLALQPGDNTLLLAVDVQNYAMLIQFHRGIVLHRFLFSKRVRVAEFCPTTPASTGGSSSDLVAVAAGKHVQVWCTPTTTGTAAAVKEFSPLIQHRVYTGLSADVTCVAWSFDGTVLAAGSRDSTVRLWTVQTIKDYQPVTLAGHKRAIVGVYLIADTTAAARQQPPQIHSCYTVSEDGALVTWECQYPNHDDETTIRVLPDDNDKNNSKEMEDQAVDFFTGGKHATTTLSSSPQQQQQQGSSKSQAHQLVHATWRLQSRHYFNQDGASVTSVSYSPTGQLLAVGFSSGLFGLYEMPSVANIHTLSVGGGNNVRVQACTLNNTGDWLALGCPQQQQLLVWEWRSETYIIQQRGHGAGMMRCMAYSADGVVICTGGEDGHVKLWNATSGFCYVTLGGGSNKKSSGMAHTAPVTAVQFANASVVLSASLDGTVKAHDLHRYRTFKTFTTPTPVQFTCLAVDAAGEIVTAGCTDPFHVYVWNLQTGKLLDVLTGHAGPVSGLCFAPAATGAGAGTLVSASWDGTVKVWDLYKGGAAAPTESLTHGADVVCVAFRPDGQEICTGTVTGLLSFWNVEQARLKYEIDGRGDISGGRKLNDRMTADHNAAGRYFTSVCYSADGSCVLAGGNSKFVCIYQVSQQILLKKFQVTFNRSLDGVLDELNSKNLGAGGPMDDHADMDVDESTYNALYLPGARRGDDGSRRSKVEVLTMAVAFSSTGREWAAVSGEGLHVYSLDEDMIFDPISLTEAITPAAVQNKLASQDYALALRMALHLNETSLVKQVMEHTPFASIALVVRSCFGGQQQQQQAAADPVTLERLLQALAVLMAESPHIEFYLQWCLELLQNHGLYMEKHRGLFMRAFRSLHKAVQTSHQDLRRISDENKYMLDFLQDQAEQELQQ